MAKKEQPLFVKFYNLHLTSEAGSYPNEDERRKLIEFFSEHEPRIADDTLYEEAARASADNSLMKNGIMTPDRMAASEYPHLTELYGIARFDYGLAGTSGMELKSKQVESLLEYELYGFMLHLLAIVKTDISRFAF